MSAAMRPFSFFDRSLALVVCVGKSLCLFREMSLALLWECYNFALDKVLWDEARYRTPVSQPFP